MQFDALFRKRLLFVLLPLYMINGLLQGQELILNYDNDKKEFAITEYLSLLDSSVQISEPDELLYVDDNYWLEYSKINIDDLKAETWCQFTLFNSFDRIKQVSLEYGFYLDSIDVYIKNSEGFHLLASNGKNVPYSQRQIRAYISVFQLTLMPLDTVQVFARIVQEYPPYRNFIQYQELKRTSHIHLFDFREAVLQNFIFGVLMLFVTLGLLLFLIFRENDLIYYSCLMFFLSVHFYLRSTGIYLLKDIEGPWLYVLNRWPYLAISMIFIYIFVSSRLELKQRRAVLNKIYKWLTLLYAAFLIIFVYLIPIPPLFPLGFILTLVVLAITLWVILEARFSKHPEANNLLLSMAILVVSAIINTIVGYFNPGYDAGLWNYIVQLGIIAFAASLLFNLFKRITDIRIEKLHAEVSQEKSDELLFNVLPEKIALQLKETGTTEAEHLEGVSVLFTDFKGFTQMAARLSANELVDELQYCFEKFDRIMDKYGIEKIKTIGDSYMAAAGLNGNSKASSARLVSAGLEMLDVIEKRCTDGLVHGKESFQMRAGIHTGPVIAGVVGVKKFQYDIWGDTVNTASRMESHGEVGKLNISHDTYLLIKDDKRFSIENRGILNVKGKGEIQMYFVSLREER